MELLILIACIYFFGAVLFFWAFWTYVIIVAIGAAMILGPIFGLWWLLIWLGLPPGYSLILGAALLVVALVVDWKKMILRRRWSRRLYYWVKRQEDPVIANARYAAERAKYLAKQELAYRRTLIAQGFNPDDYSPKVPRDTDGACASPTSLGASSPRS
jgi:hypothetical protein